MSVLAYSFKEKKLVPIVGKIELKKYQLPNGNTVTMAKGLSKDGDKLSVIVSNVRKPACPNGKPRNKVGAKCQK